MASSSSLSDRLYHAYWQDGSLDLFAGLGLAAIGAGWLCDQVALSAALPAMIVPFWMVFRLRLVEPRLGHVRFDQNRRSQLTLGRLLLLAVGCLVLLACIAAYVAVGRATAPVWRDWVSALPALLVGFAGLLSAFLFKINRLGLYGLVCIGLGFLFAAFDQEPGWSLLAGGLVTIASGGWLLRRFFHQFPALPNEPE